ncbi:MAG: hypothetical protein ACOCSR_00995 [Wenzhouxiangella sp.]
MSANLSSRELREQIVGKRISGVIARPGRGGEPPMVLMLRFDDGSVVEFVSPRSDRILRQALSARSAHGRNAETAAGQLPLQGLAA